MTEPDYKLSDAYKARLDEAAEALSLIPEGVREAFLENLQSFCQTRGLKLTKTFDGPTVGTAHGTLSLEITFGINELIAAARIAGKF